jgi:regulator of replication initiation timing
MTLLWQDNISLIEELTKCRDHVYQLLREENDQQKEIQELLEENALLKEEQLNLD